MKKFKGIELYLLDMDGTIYLENELIPGAREFIGTLIEKKAICFSDQQFLRKQKQLFKQTQGIGNTLRGRKHLFFRHGHGHIFVQA